MKAVKPATTRVTELDGLRGLLAWTVVGAHLLLVCGWFDPLARRFAVIGETPESAVDLFMLLSGLAITHLLMLRPTPRQFFFGRICRIVPAYYLALLAGILCNNLLADNLRRLPPGTIGHVYLQICQIGQERLWLDAPLHLFLLHGLIPTAWLPAIPYTLLGVAWSLSLEFQFYLVAPALFAWCRRSRVLLGVTVLFAVIATLCAGRVMATFSSAFLGSKCGFFLAGSFSYFALQRAQSARKFLLLGILPSALLGLAWWLGTRHLFESILPPLIWSIVIAAARLHGLSGLSRLLNSRLLQFLGRVSYSTYLFHAPVIILLQLGIWRWAVPRSTATLLLWTSGLAIPAVVFVSWLSWRFIENPFQRLGHSARFRNSRVTRSLSDNRRG